ncbi:hypothetical protein [[Eubacterium] hominis]|uniref:phosphorylase family protein n=1 Tax=[Eubacterium] hominis TaxID=2764325 RepID=UPI003A4DF4A0
MKILLIEDSDGKRDVKEFLKKNKHELFIFQTVDEAKERLMNKQYDIVITDMQIPIDLTQGPEENGGIMLYDYIIHEDEIFQPKGVIAISSYVNNDIVVKCNQLGLQIIDYSKEKDEWEHQLKDAINKYENKNKIDVAIVNAVEVEFEEAKNTFGGSENADGFYESVLSNDLKVLVCSPLSMGLIPITELITKLIVKYDPEMIIMTGIAAGLGSKDSKGFCDVLVAESAWDYSSTTIQDNEEKNDFTVIYNASPNKIDVDLRKIFNKYKANKDLCSQLRKDIYNSDIKIHVGPFASGTAVIKSEYYINKVISPLNKKFIGLDMETAGLYYAALNSDKHPVYFISMKCLSDWGNTEKNKIYQEKGSRISAKLALYFLENDYKSFIRLKKK